MVLFLVKCRDGSVVPVDLEPGMVIDLANKTWWQDCQAEDAPNDTKLKDIKVDHLKAMLDMLGYVVNKKKPSKQD